MKQNFWPARLGIAAWPAFIGAGALTALIFVYIDVGDLKLITGSTLDDLGIYSLAFFIFWLFGTLCGGASAWLAYTSQPPSRHRDRRHANPGAD